MIRLALLVLAFSSIHLSAITPDRVLVVANRNSAVSRSIAEYYARKRGVPLPNVCYIRTSPEETISRAVYDREIAAAVTKCLRADDRIEKIWYIVTTLGVPLRIEGGGTAASRDGAAVDSELALLYFTLQGGRYGLAGAYPNPFFGKREERFGHPAFPIYLVTRLAAYDFAGVRALIDRSLQAADRGKVILDLKSADDAAGNNWLRTAAILLPKDRVLLEETTSVVTGEKDVIGFASWGSNDPNRKQRFLSFRWLPGAIMTEFVSTNGRTFQKPPEDWTISTWRAEDKPKWFFGSPQSMAADYVLEGATGASGHVDEPYLSFTPRPDLLFPAYLKGRTLAESYYLAMPGLSWQNIVIGDPLCRLR